MKELICSYCGAEWDYNHELHGIPMETMKMSITVPYLSSTAATSASSSTDEAPARAEAAKEPPPDDASWELT